MVEETKRQRKTGFLSDIKLRTKILAGFATVILIFGIASALSFINLKDVESEVHHYAEVVEEAAGASKIEAAFIRLDLHAREFAASGNEAQIAKVKDVATRIRDLIASERKHALPEDQSARIDQIEHDLDLYMADFRKSVELEHEFQQLVNEEMEPSGDKIAIELQQIRTAAQQVGNGEAERLATIAREHILLLRLYSNIMIGRHDESFASKVAQEIEVSKETLASLGAAVRTDEERALFEDVRRLFQHYISALEKAHADEKALRSLVDGEMTKLSEDVAKATSAFEQAAAKWSGRSKPISSRP